jgi:drug/metabolite transporter (DMT)-like permease
MNRLFLIVPAMCDLITSTLHFIALNYVSTSAYQMVNGGNIITCFLFSIFFLRQPLKRCQLFGSFLAVVGITIVGVANIINTQSD